MQLIIAGRPVTSQGGPVDGWLAVDGDLIVEAGEGRPPRPPDLDTGQSWLVPGFVDVHLHGGGGHAVRADRDALRGVLNFHAGRGTTSALLSLVSAPLEEMVATAGVVADVTATDPRLLGCHFEGPFLSATYCGAHDPAVLLAPTPAELERLLAAARGTARVVTLAPELPGGVAAIRQVVAAGAVAAVGHTGADHQQTLAALAAGARHATHLFNAMPPVHHRIPGPVVALLGDARVTVELILDGIHVHDATARLAVDAAGAGRVVLVTDAMAAAGMPEGAFQLEGQPVVVQDGAVRLVGGTSLAGSVLTMDAAFRRAIQQLQCSPAEAVAMTSTNAARLLGFADRIGSLQPGRAADIVVLDDDLQVERVMKAGRWLEQT